MFSFIVKSLSRVVLFLWYDVEWASSLCLGKLSSWFLSLAQLPTLFALCFQCHSVPLKLFVWNILPVSLPLGHPHLFTAKIHRWTHLYWVPLTANVYRLWSGCRSLHSHSEAVASVTPFTFNLNFTSNVTLLSSLLHFHFDQFPFKATFFVKRHMGLPLADEANTRLCLNWIIDAQSQVTNGLCDVIGH